MAFARFSSLADAGPDTEALSGPSFSVTRHQLRHAALCVAQRLLDAARHRVPGQSGAASSADHLGTVAAGCVWCPVDVEWCVLRSPGPLPPPL